MRGKGFRSAWLEAMAESSSTEARKPVMGSGGVHTYATETIKRKCPLGRAAADGMSGMTRDEPA
jgi:hypothetical protein